MHSIIDEFKQQASFSTIRDIVNINAICIVSLCFHLFVYYWSTGLISGINGIVMCGIYMIYTLFNFTWLGANFNELHYFITHCPMTYWIIVLFYSIPTGYLWNSIIFYSLNIGYYISKSTWDLIYTSSIIFYISCAVFVCIYLLKKCYN